MREPLFFIYLVNPPSLYLPGEHLMSAEMTYLVAATGTVLIVSCICWPTKNCSVR